MTCGFFHWLGIEHLYWHEEKKFDISSEFWGKNWNISILSFFFVEKWAKSRSESHIVPKSPSNFFPEFGSPRSVQLGTSVNWWETRRNFGHFWPYLAKYQIWHFWQKSYPLNLEQNGVRTSISCWRQCLFITFDILDPNFEVCLHTSPTYLPLGISKNE